MTKKELRQTFANLANVHGKGVATYYTDCFLEAIRQGLLEDGVLKIPGLFTIQCRTVPAGEKMIYNPSSGKYNSRKEHRYLRISESGDCLTKSSFQYKYKVDGLQCKGCEV